MGALSVVALQLIIFGRCAGGFLDYVDMEDAFYTIWNSNPRSDQSAKLGKCTGLASDGFDVQGTCLNLWECDSLKGSKLSSSSCGYFRTCCVVAHTCDQKTTSKVAYFKYPFQARKNCKYTVVPQEGVCQIKVDFLQFQMKPAGGTFRCEDHYLKVNDKLDKPLGLCGKNTGQHLYLHVNEKTEVKFEIYNRDLSEDVQVHMKVTQLRCRLPSLLHYKIGTTDVKMLAPSGCRQYFTENRHVVSLSYDENPSTSTPQNDYSICIKKTDNCKIRYSNIKYKTDSVPAPGVDVPDYLYLAGNPNNPKIFTTTTTPLSYTCSAPGLFFLDFVNPNGNHKFSLDFETC